MESRRPKPVTSRAIVAEIPNIVINSRFLYRKIFRNVDFVVKFSRFQIKGMYSSRTLFPTLGAARRIRSAGYSRSSFIQESPVAAMIQTKEIIKAWIAET